MSHINFTIGHSLLDILRFNSARHDRRTVRLALGVLPPFCSEYARSPGLANLRRIPYHDQKWKDWGDTALGPFPSSLLVHRFSWRRIVRPHGDSVQVKLENAVVNPPRRE